MSRFVCRVAPGCHRGSGLGAVVSRHRTWEAALNAASKNDRLVAVDEQEGHQEQIPQQNDPKVGSGRYGNGLVGVDRTDWVRARDGRQ